MTGIGDSLNPYQNIEVLAARTPQELRDQIKSITVPDFKILHMYADQGRHYCWFIGSVIVKRKKKKKE